MKELKATVNISRKLILSRYLIGFSLVISESNSWKQGFISKFLAHFDKNMLKVAKSSLLRR